VSAVVTCPSCAAECPDGSRFCPSCGAALTLPPSHAVERKIVTAVFCDLVGFTALCEEIDSEDVDHLLREFYGLARRTIETWGGVVEKFVGDAVVGIFGVPTTHEDDPERAVATAIRLLDRLPELPQLAGRRLEARVGINTGAAVVRLDVAPGSGEGFLIGDAVNTAARLQKLAPPMGIVVGEKTRELTSRSFAYYRLAPAAVKGKRGEVRHWLVRGPISRLGVDLRQEFPAPLVGREVELGILKGLLKKVRASSQPQFAIVVGEAGIGKSRLLFEFLRHVDSRPAIVRWRQGRCPAYGDGLTFWPLGEIVKEQLGVTDSDNVAAIEAKLSRALAGEDDGEWLAARLRPLLSLKSPAASRDENFAAWRRFVELVAVDSPAVVVFEDLHWASEATLAFLEYLLAELRGAPLLVVGTSRTELLSARPDLDQRLSAAVGSGRIVRIDLEPLTELETQTMVNRVGHRLGGLAETRQAIARRSAGNPLYVEQLVRLLEEESPAAGRSADLVLKEKVAEALPESLQSLIAARLDELPPERKTQLADAAVVGAVFWTGAVAALDHGDRQAAAGGLEELRRRDLVQSRRNSSIVGEDEFTFSHTLIRDVAYGQLSRAARAAKHAAVAWWVETEVGDHLGDVTEIIAHHYATALELAGLAGDRALAGELLAPAVRALGLAGDSALALDVAAAEEHYRRAVRLVPAESPLRPRLLTAWGNALAIGGKPREAALVLEEGIEGLRALGAPRVAAIAMTWLARVFVELADNRAPAVARQAVALLDDDEPSPELLVALERWSSVCLSVSDTSAALEAADRALHMAARLELPAQSELLEIRAAARCALGDASGGLEDMRRALASAEAGVPSVVHMAAGELAATFETVDGGLSIHREGLRIAQARHDETGAAGLRVGVFEDLIFLGEWDEAAADCDALEGFLAASGQAYSLQDVRSLKALLLVLRGEAEAARPLAAWIENEGQGLLGPPCLNLLASAATREMLGDSRTARSALEMLVECPESFCVMPRITLWWPLAVRLAVALADHDLTARLARRLLDSPAAPHHARVTTEALEEAVTGRFAAAAAGFAAAAAEWREVGVPYERAQALFWRGRCLHELGRTPEARLPLVEAHDIFARLGARPAHTEAAGLLHEVAAASSTGGRARLK
jgi:class 3 adenylate cyclase/tetratricopeptide (TPR) repeat protein